MGARSGASDDTTMQRVADRHGLRIHDADRQSIPVSMVQSGH
jgi:hypothetical protein